MLEDKSIVDTTESGFYPKEVVKSSDNLLDLLEVGDMVELDYGVPLYIYNINKKFIEVLPNERVFFDEPIAIWKRNGDVMRRYEV
jgi:hypothetical protein